MSRDSVWRKSIRLSPVVATLLLVGSAYQARAAVTLTPVVTNINAPIGIACCPYAGATRLVLSDNWPFGAPTNFATVDLTGLSFPKTGVTQVGPGGAYDELKLAEVPASMSTLFGVGRVYFGWDNGPPPTPGLPPSATPPITVGYMNCDGTGVNTSWATLYKATPFTTANLETAIVSGLAFDTTGLFGGGLVVMTSDGNIFKIPAGGGPVAPFTSIKTFFPDVLDTEGLTIVPASSKYSAWAGKILAGGEELGRVYAISPAGSVTGYKSPSVVDPEELRVVPANADFYGVDFGPSTSFPPAPNTGRVLAAPAYQFTGMVGDVVLAEQFSNTTDTPGNAKLWDVVSVGSPVAPPNVSTFQVAQIATATHWEQITFCPAVPNACPLSQGYFKNHLSADKPLTIGGVALTPAQIVNILKTPPAGGNAADILIHQLIAAEESILNGSDPLPVLTTIQQANALLTGHVTTSGVNMVQASTPTGQQMTALASILDAYANGKLTPGCVGGD